MQLNPLDLTHYSLGTPTSLYIRRHTPHTHTLLWIKPAGQYTVTSLESPRTQHTNSVNLTGPLLSFSSPVLRGTWIGWCSPPAPIKKIGKERSTQTLFFKCQSNTDTDKQRQSLMNKCWWLSRQVTFNNNNSKPELSISIQLREWIDSPYAHCVKWYIHPL